MNHFQCKTYIIHSGWLRQGIQFSCNCNIKVSWLSEVGITIKYKWGIIAFYIVLYDYIVLKYSHVWALQSVTTWHANMLYICLIQRLNRKWPLHFLLSQLPMILCVIPSFYTSHCFTTHVSTAIWSSLIAGLDIWNRTIEWKKEWNSEHTQLRS